jgi:hypothetical protein
MSIIDTTDRVLNALAEQGAPEAVIDATRALRADVDQFERTGYLPDVLRTKTHARRAEYVTTVAQQLRDLEANEEKLAVLNLDLHDQREHARVTAATGHGAIDLDRVKVATSPAELSVLMREAMAHSEDGARRAWGFIEPRLREMAAREQRQRVIGTGNTAFGLLCRWQLEMRTLSQRSPDRAHLSEAGIRRRREIRQQVLAIARVVGLDQQVDVAARQAALAEKPTTTMEIGRWFDQFNKRT